MKLTSYKTPILYPNSNLLEIIFSVIPTLPEKSVLCISSKAVALAEGSVEKKITGTREEKHVLVAREADSYLPANLSEFDVMLTITNGMLAVNAGIDESNANDLYVLWPKDPYASAAWYWKKLREHYSVKELGIVITDSKTTPLRWGIIGTSVSYCGFQALFDRIGEPDIFGRKLVMTKENIAEGLAVSANIEMGEGADRKPLVVVEDIPRINFSSQPPSQSELDLFNIAPEDDVYGPLLTSVSWQKNTKS
ncbi:MAG: putative folate metabolism gamma-glutamate ligase [Candidatus Pacebacteria bacterium CG_4_10_14_0_8_um_filter_42_14]|nr:MAG: putative folate metabolism gamma-glutamate ligase [Candidatus Pacebacteria bacterium CG_4_10_14_0_8_um_filter_42_14]